MIDWTAANARIMAKLLLEGKLATKETAQYLGCTAKVVSLCQHYMWSSVLLYDREYRRSEAAYKFPWGSDVQHLATTQLIPRCTAGNKLSKPIVKQNALPKATSSADIKRQSLCENYTIIPYVRTGKFVSSSMCATFAKCLTPNSNILDRTDDPQRQQEMFILTINI